MLAGRELPPVALRKESVDRNSYTVTGLKNNDTSLSVRRAWIEIFQERSMRTTGRSLSVRRAWIEIIYSLYTFASQKSLSVRRAWIEIWVLRKVPILGIVALRKESVDRNNVIRPAIDVFLASLSVRRAWIEI